MARDLGDAFINVTPQTDGFRAMLAAKLKSAIAGIRGEVPIDAQTLKLDAAIANAQAKVAALRASTSDIQLAANSKALDAAIAAAQAKIAALKESGSDLRLDADAKALTAKIAGLQLQQAKLADSLESMTADVEIRAATTKIIAISAEIKALESEASQLKLDADNAALVAKIAAAQGELDVLQSEAKNIKIDADITAMTAKLAAAEAEVKTVGDTATKGGTQAYAPWYSLWSLIGRKVTLFGGAFGTNGILASVGAVHLLIDVIAEVIAVLAPAAVALTAFGIAASSTVADIVKQEQAMFTITTALGGTFPGLSAGLQHFTDSVKPEVYVLFGEALNTINDHTGVFQTLATGAGHALDGLGARAENALGGNGIGGLVSKGVDDITLLGDVIANVFGIFGNVLKQLPGYAELLFTALRNITGALEAITGNNAIQDLLGIGLAMHGAIIYGGLLVTAILALRGPLTSFGSLLVTIGLSIAAYVESIVVAEGASATFAAVLAPLAAVNPFVWVAVAIGALTALAIWLANVKTASQQMYDAIIAQVNAATTFTQANTDLTQGIQQTNAQLQNTAKYITVTQVGMHGLTQTVTELNPQYQGLTDNQKNLGDTQQTLNERMNELVKVTGSQSSALQDLNDIGVKAGAVATESAQAFASQLTQIKALVAAETQLAGFTSGPALAAQNALTNEFLQEQLPAIQKIVQAEGNLLSVITGGQTAFNNFQQSIQGTTAKFVSPSGLAQAAQLAKGNLTGVNEQSLAFSNTLYNISIPALQKLIGSLQEQGATTQQLTTVVATGAGQMLQYAGKNEEARAVIVALINNALGPGTVSLQNLNKWVGQNSTTLGGMNSIVAESTVKAASLAGVLNDDLVKAFQASLFNASGAKGAIDQMTNAIVNQGTNSDAFRSARSQLIADLEKTGLSSQQAKTYVDNLQNSIDALHGKTVPVGVVLSGSGGIAAVINSTGTAAAVQGGGHLVISTAGAAAGWYVPGSGDKDTVPAMLTPGEVVVPKGMVKQGAVDHLRGKIPGFAAGGVVGGSLNSAVDYTANQGSSFAAQEGTAFVKAVEDAFNKAVAAAKAAAAAAAGTPVAYSAVAGVTQWEPDVLQVLSMLGLPAADLPTVMAQILTESGGNPNAINLCLTLDAMILTRRGWLKHDEVQAGDETIGYNFTTGRNEWTLVTAVHHYEDAPLVRIGNSRWHATVTPEHRWVNAPRMHVLVPELGSSCHLCPWPEGVRRRGATTAGGLRIHLAKVHGIRKEVQKFETGEARFTATKDIRSRDRLVLSAVADTGTGLDITVQEAAILGWVAGDGHVEKYVDKPRGRKKPSMSIAQSKLPMVAKISALLEGTPHAHYTEAPRLSRVNKKVMAPRHTWRLDPDYAQDLIQRAGHPKDDAFRQVLQMSAEQRRAWLDAFTDAEGHRVGEYVSVTQAHGPVLEAAHLAIYLCGYRPRREEIPRQEEHWSLTARISAGRPVVSGSFLEKRDAGRGPVWCVTTELGSWTAEQDGQFFLTGNSDSNAAAGDPSRGLLQVIGSTFAAYRNPSLSPNIYDPLANIYAGLNYAIHRYGNPGWLSVLGQGHGYAAGGLVGSLAASQAAEKSAYAGVSSAVTAGLAHPNAYFTSHKASLTGELATLTKRQGTEQSAYAALAGKGLTAANLKKLTTQANDEISTASDKYLSTAVSTKGLIASLQALDKVTASGATTVAGAASATKSTTSSAATGASEPPAGATTMARLGQQEKAEAGAFSAVANALAAAFAHPTAFVTSHKTSLTGELATLTNRQNAEVAAYKALSGAGLTAANLSKFATTTRAETSTAQDKFLSTAVSTGVLTAALATLAASAGKGVIPSAAIAQANQSTAATSKGITGEGSAATSVLSEAQYTADFAAVKGLNLGEIQKSAHLSHLWHLLHLQHLADLGLNSGGIVPSRTYDQGGWLPPGTTLVHNGTGQPEQVVAPGGSRRLSADAEAIIAALERNTAAVTAQAGAMAHSLNSVASASAARGSYSTRR